MPRKEVTDHAQSSTKGNPEARHSKTKATQMWRRDLLQVKEGEVHHYAVPESA